jgi:hypothetical protein
MFISDGENGVDAWNMEAEKALHSSYRIGAHISW